MYATFILKYKVQNMALEVLFYCLHKQNQMFKTANKVLQFYYLKEKEKLI